MEKMDLSELEFHLAGHWLSDLANFSALVFAALPDINWVGFYLSDGKVLRLGPFMGKPACQQIAFGKGVCGTAFTSQEILIVDDVDVFPGHIRCDSNSKSEIVLPFFMHGKIVGVLDVDSPSLARFTASDREVLENALQLLATKLSLSGTDSFGRL